MLGQNLRTGGGEHPGRLDQILQANRNTVERAAIMAGADLLLSLAGELERPIGGHGDIGVQLRILSFDSLEDDPGELNRRDLAALEELGRLAKGQVGKIVVHGAVTSRSVLDRGLLKTSL